MPNALHVLVVEDEPIIAMMLEDHLGALGLAVAGIAASVDEALGRLAGGGIDLAVLDVRLRDDAPSWPVAEALVAGGIPFLFASGGMVGTLPAALRDVPVLAKPYGFSDVRDALERLGISNLPEGGRAF